MMVNPVKFSPTHQSVPYRVSSVTLIVLPQKLELFTENYAENKVNMKTEAPDKVFIVSG